MTGVTWQQLDHRDPVWWAQETQRRPPPSKEPLEVDRMGRRSLASPFLPACRLLPVTAVGPAQLEAG